MADDTFALSLQGAARPSEADFGAIEDAFMETERGRWFLNEFARRNRHADTVVVLAALTRIENLLRARKDEQPEQAAIAANPSAIKPNGDGRSKSVPVERVLAEAAAQLRAALEPVQDLAWSLRERGDARCELLDIRAKEIAQTCDLFETLQKELNARPMPEQPLPDMLAEKPAEASASAAPPKPSPRTSFRITPIMPERPAPPAAEKAADIRDQAEPRDAALDEILFGEEPMTDIIADAQRLAAATPDSSPAAQAPRAPVPEAHPAGAHEPAQPTPPEKPQMTPSERMKGLFDQLHQARWGSHSEKPATTVVTQARADSAAVETPVEKDDRQQEPSKPAPVLALDNLFGESFSFALPEAEEKPPAKPADAPLEPWPRVSSRPDAPAKAAAETPKADIAKPPAVTAPPAKPRPAKDDPLAPIVGLSDEEKIALFS